MTAPSTEATTIDPTPNAPQEGQQRGTKLFVIGAAGLAALLAYYGYTSKLEDPLHLYFGLFILFLAILPCLLWARRGGRHLPTFEVLMLTTANAYGLPLLTGHIQLKAYDFETISTAALGILVYQITAISTFLLIRGRPIRSPMFMNEVLTRDLKKFVAYGLLLSTAYSVISVYYSDLIPSETNSILRAVSFGIGMVSTFAQARSWGQKELAAYEKIFLVVMISVQAASQFSTLYLVTGMSLIVLGLVGYVSGARKLPFVATLAFFSIAALLHNGKSTMRSKYWGAEGVREQITVQQLPAFFSEWVEAGLSTTGQDDEREMTKKLLERSSVFHIMCLVVSNSPERLPYLNGETYVHVPGQLIPRFFWKDKPQAHVATDILCIYYGLQDEVTVRNATIGFGMIAEAYANFGFYGVGLLAFVFGAVYKRIQTATSESPMLSYPGIFVIVLTAWSFQTESTMAIWISSMSQACVAVLGLPFVVRNFAGG